METGLTNTSERVHSSPRPPTISQHSSSRAAREVRHGKPAEPTQTQPVVRQQRNWLKSLVCSCTSLSQLGTKVSLRGLSICIRTSVEGGKMMFVDSGKKKEKRTLQTVTLDCVDRLNPTLPHKRVRKSKGYVTYCDFSLEVHSVSLS